MKRAIDLTSGVVGLVVCAPVLIGLIVLIRWTSPGGGLLRQRRIGRYGQVFTCYKLRTMYAGTGDRATHLVGEAAITPIGRILRKTKLDELPQLYNVARGEMSLVGPRPCLPSQHELICARNRRGVLADFEMQLRLVC